MNKSIILTIASIMFLAANLNAQDTIIEEWSHVKLPTVIVPVQVTVDPATTALLVLDIEPLTVPSKPRAVAVVPKIKKLAEWARSNKRSHLGEVR